MFLPVDNFLNRSRVKEPPSESKALGDFAPPSSSPKGDFSFRSPSFFFPALETGRFFCSDYFRFFPANGTNQGPDPASVFEPAPLSPFSLSWFYPPEMIPPPFCLLSEEVNSALRHLSCNSHCVLLPSFSLYLEFLCADAFCLSACSPNHATMYSQSLNRPRLLRIVLLFFSTLPNDRTTRD